MGFNSGFKGLMHIHFFSQYQELTALMQLWSISTCSSDEHKAYY